LIEFENKRSSEKMEVQQKDIKGYEYHDITQIDTFSNKNNFKQPASTLPFAKWRSQIKGYSDSVLKIDSLSKWIPQ